MSYEPVADTDLAAVVTFLEMRARPEQEVPPSLLSLRRIDRPDLGEYRRLFRLVGARWLWFSRLIMDDAALAAIIRDPKVELYSVLDEDGRDAGILELDFRDSGQCELAEAIRRAWRDGIQRVHVHTCSLDHPAALSAYVRAGFTPYRRAVERFPDPRAFEILPADCAPQAPLLAPVRRPAS